MSNTEVFEQLSKFPRYESLSHDLCSFVNGEKKFDESEVEELKRKLLSILGNPENDTQKAGELLLSDAAYNALFLLEELNSSDKKKITSSEMIIGKADTCRDAFFGLMRREINPLSAEAALDIRKLNDVQIRTLKVLYDTDLTVKHFSGKDDFNTEAHSRALIYLMKKTEPCLDAAALSNMSPSFIIARANRAYRMDVIKAACAQYLTFREQNASGSRGLSFSREGGFQFRMSHLYHGKSGERRVQKLKEIESSDSNDYGTMLSLLKELSEQSGTKKHSFKRYFWDAVIATDEDSKTVGKKLSREHLRELEDLNLQDELMNLTLKI